MLRIKLARFGKRGQPHYRIVVTEARSKRDGRYVALLGHYTPTLVPKILEFNVSAYSDWLKKGAQPTDTVAGLYKRYQSGTPFPTKTARPSKRSAEKSKAAAESAATAKEETDTVVNEEAPAKTETDTSSDETTTVAADAVTAETQDAVTPDTKE